MACILKAWTILLHLHKAWPREAPQLRTVGKDEGMNKSQSKTKQILHDWRQVRGIITCTMLAPNTSPGMYRVLNTCWMNWKGQREECTKCLRDSEESRMIMTEHARNGFKDKVAWVDFGMILEGQSGLACPVASVFEVLRQVWRILPQANSAWFGGIYLCNAFSCK